MRILAQVCAHVPRAGPEARLQQSTATTPAPRNCLRFDSRLRDISRATSGGKEEEGSESGGLWQEGGHPHTASRAGAAGRQKHRARAVS